MNEIALTNPGDILILALVGLAILGVIRDLANPTGLWQSFFTAELTPKIEREAEEENNGGE